MVPQFRPATLSDIPAMQRVRLAVKENILSDPSLVADEDVAREISKTGRGWVSEVEGKVVGFAIVNLEERNVWALFIDPEHEKQGIGRELHHRMMDWYFSRTDVTIWLGTDPGTRAEEFYRRQGWQVSGMRENGEIRFEMRKEDWLERES